MATEKQEQEFLNSANSDSDPDNGGKNYEANVEQIPVKGTVETEDSGAPMSKRKRKRLEQKLKKQQFLKDKRQKERLRKKERLKEARSQGITVGPSRKALKHNTMEKSQCKVKVVIDCSFDSLMTEKDIKSIVKQVNFCYAANRRATDPVQFHMTSFSGQTKVVMDSIGDYLKWDVNMHPTDFLDVFGKKDVIYLSSDSKNVLKTLDDEKIYIIGGLVDHNHHKGICLQLAEEKGLSHAQLPIGAYVSLESRTTLAVNHVFEILLRYTESRDWKDAFYKVIPKRKVVAQCDTATASTSSSCGITDQESSENTDKNHCDSKEQTMASGSIPEQDNEHCTNNSDTDHSVLLISDKPETENVSSVEAESLQGPDMKRKIEEIS